jgi:hypothetical protein
MKYVAGCVIRAIFYVHKLTGPYVFVVYEDTSRQQDDYYKSYVRSYCIVFLLLQGLPLGRIHWRVSKQCFQRHAWKKPLLLPSRKSSKNSSKTIFFSKKCFIYELSLQLQEIFAGTVNHVDKKCVVARVWEKTLEEHDVFKAMHEACSYCRGIYIYFIT